MIKLWYFIPGQLMVMIKINLQSTWRYKTYLVSCYFSCRSGVTEFYNHKVMGFNPSCQYFYISDEIIRHFVPCSTEFKHNKVVLCERTIKVYGLYLSRDAKPSGWYCGLRESHGFEPEKGLWYCLQQDVWFYIHGCSPPVW